MKLDGYSNGLKEKRFGMPFTIDVADFVPQIFKELNSIMLSLKHCSDPPFHVAENLDQIANQSGIRVIE